MIHRPPHFLQNETWYFLTAHTYGSESVFKTKDQKDIWLQELLKLVAEFQIEVSAWVLLDNHYHLLGYFEDKGALPQFVKRLHGVSSFKINHLDHVKGRSVWYSYWDRCVRDERDYWTRFNYIHYNPVKHGYVERAELWGYSSYRDIVVRNGQEWIDDVWESYPILEYDFEGKENSI